MAYGKQRWNKFLLIYRAIPSRGNVCACICKLSWWKMLSVYPYHRVFALSLFNIVSYAVLCHIQRVMHWLTRSSRYLESKFQDTNAIRRVPSSLFNLFSHSFGRSAVAFRAKFLSGTGVLNGNVNLTGKQRGERRYGFSFPVKDNLSWYLSISFFQNEGTTLWKRRQPKLPFY